MKDNMDKHLDKLIGKVMEDMPLESPSIDFTANILSKVKALPQSEATVYKPLISKNVWFGIGTLVLGLSIYLTFGATIESSSWLSFLNFEKIPSVTLPSLKFPTLLSGVKISKTFMYSIVIFAVFLFVQIPLLKKQFDKQLEY